MIDFDDADDTAWLAFFCEGPLAIIVAIVAVILFCMAVDNKNECAKKTCPADMKPKLTQHDCVCVVEAR